MLDHDSRDSALGILGGGRVEAPHLAVLGAVGRQNLHRPRVSALQPGGQFNSFVEISVRPKQNFCRNTETETLGEKKPL